MIAELIKQLVVESSNLVGWWETKSWSTPDRYKQTMISEECRQGYTSFSMTPGFAPLCDRKLISGTPIITAGAISRKCIKPVKMFRKTTHGGMMFLTIANNLMTEYVHVKTERDADK